MNTNLSNFLTAEIGSSVHASDLYWEVLVCNLDTDTDYVA